MARLGYFDGYLNLSFEDDRETIRDGEQGELGVRALAGNDSVKGSDADDTLYGNQDEDTLRGEDGNDFLQGGRGDDRILGRDDRDILGGNRGNDELEGGNGRDTLRGGQGDDTLRGDDGDDLLVGDLGTDDLYGGDGDDIFTFRRDDDVTDVLDADVAFDFDDDDDFITFTSRFDFFLDDSTDYSNLLGGSDSVDTVIRRGSGPNGRIIGVILDADADEVAIAIGESPTPFF